MKRKNLYFICHLTDIFNRCMFFMSKMAFDRHDTRQIFALALPIYPYGGSWCNEMEISLQDVAHIFLVCLSISRVSSCRFSVCELNNLRLLLIINCENIDVCRVKFSKNVDIMVLICCLDRIHVIRRLTSSKSVGLVNSTMMATLCLSFMHLSIIFCISLTHLTRIKNLQGTRLVFCNCIQLKSIMQPKPYICI